MPDFLPRLFAVLIAYATNLGLHGIAAKSSFSYAELAQLSDWGGSQDTPETGNSRHRGLGGAVPA